MANNDGKFKLPIKSGGDVGGQAQVLKAVKNGKYAGAVVTHYAFHELVPRLDLFDLPYLFPSTEPGKVKAALKAAKKVGPAGRVVAVEANPSSIRLLKKNIQAHNPDNLTMVHAAVYNANQPVSLFTGGGQNNSLYEELHDQLYDDPVFRYEKSETVPGKTVDTLLEEAGFPVDTMPVFISFEINGAEVSALEGMTGFFSRSPHFVLRIAARSAGKNQPSRAKELSKKLSAYSNVSIRNVPPFIYAFRYLLA